MKLIYENGRVIHTRYEPHRVGYISTIEFRGGLRYVIAQAKLPHTNTTPSDWVIFNEPGIVSIQNEFPTFNWGSFAQEIHILREPQRVPPPTRPQRQIVPEPEPRTLREKNRQHTKKSSNGMGLTEKVKALFRPKNGWE